MRAIFRDLAGVNRLIRDYPLNRGVLGRGRAYVRFLAWQVLGRLKPEGFDMGFVNGTRLRVKRRLGGRLHYVLGLAEFDDMAFVAHLLRRDEVFVDVGANIGAYTVMAAAAAGTRCVAFEPSDKAYRYLRHNITLNRLEPQVDAEQLAVGAAPGKLTLTAGMGEVNHVLRAGESAESFQTDMTSLDSFFAGRAPPALIKVDVEGFETEVIHGAGGLLKDRVPLALLLEAAGLGRQYGYDEAALHAEIERQGYLACAYTAAGRRLEPLRSDASRTSNVIFVRDLAEARARLAEAPPFRLGRHRI